MVKRSSIRGDRKSVGNVVSFDADLQIAFEKLNLRETFSSHIKTDAGTKKVTAISRDGPIKTLKAVWTIIAAPDGGCDVSIAVDYTMKSMMLQLVVGKLTNFAAQKIMTAFEERGRALYGARSS